MDYQNFTFLAVFTVMVALLVNLALNYFTNRQEKCRHLKDGTSQTSYSDLTTLVSHRKKEQQLEKTVETLQVKLQQAEQVISTLQARHKEEMKAHRELHDRQFEIR